LVRLYPFRKPFSFPLFLFPLHVPLPSDLSRRISAMQSISSQVEATSLPSGLSLRLFIIPEAAFRHPIRCGPTLLRAPFSPVMMLPPPLAEKPYFFPFSSRSDDGFKRQLRRLPNQGRVSMICSIFPPFFSPPLFLILPSFLSRPLLNSPAQCWRFHPV